VGARLILWIMPSVPTAQSVIRVQLFARYAELFGRDQVELPATGLETVGDLLTRLRELPGGAALGAGVLVAVNLRQARPDAAIAPGDEVAILPPLAGG